MTFPIGLWCHENSAEEEVGNEKIEQPPFFQLLSHFLFAMKCTQHFLVKKSLPSMSSMA